MKTPLSRWLPTLLWLLLATSASAFYDPHLGRWINRDPLGDQAFFEQFSANKSHDEIASFQEASIDQPYGFVHNNPVSNYDPDGLVVVGIYGYGPADKLFGVPQANRVITRIASRTGGFAFGRSQDGSIRKTIRDALRNNPNEPVVLFGYSRGGVKITEIAKWILSNKTEFPCARIYLVGIDPVTVTGKGPVKVPSGVEDWTVWYQKNGGGFGPYKVVTLNFNNLDGGPFSGGSGTNYNLTGAVLGTDNKGKPIYVYHGAMPGYVEEGAVSAINGYSSKK